ncbi:MAG: glycerophosphodiester phosphodiesterase family protein [Bacilli bacterium]
MEMVKNIVVVLLAVTLIFLLLFTASQYSHTSLRRKQKLLKFKGIYFAHRGLFDNKTDHPENSLKAFEMAVENGYGIELDTQLTKDKQVVIVHDESLLRNCGIDKTIQECTYEELKQYKLFNSNETIPLFKDVLKVVDGKVPLIVEVKVGADYLETTVKGQEILDEYKGPYVVESFNPNVPRWYRKNRKDIIRGQLAYNSLRDRNNKMPYFLKFCLSNTMFNIISRPDFIAYKCNNSHHISNFICKYIYGLIMVTWTVKSQRDLNKKEKFFDILIFDSFIPQKRTSYQRRRKNKKRRLKSLYKYGQI